MKKIILVLIVLIIGGFYYFSDDKVVNQVEEENPIYLIEGIEEEKEVNTPEATAPAEGVMGSGPIPEAPINNVQIANPASVYCEVEKGGDLEIVTGEDGGQSGMCHLPDGTLVEEWELYRNEH